MNNTWLKSLQIILKRLMMSIRSCYWPVYQKKNSNRAEIPVGNNNFLTDGFGWNNLNAGSGTKIVGSWGNENNMMSYFTRLNYSFLNRYLLTATFRADGASVFAKNKKWGYFPSVAVGWNIADEQFMQFLSPDFYHA